MTDQNQRSESAKVEIVDFRSEHGAAFRQMNLDWITRYWEVEDADRLYLENPRDKILDPGGTILMALDDGEAVGTVALISRGAVPTSSPRWPSTSALVAKGSGGGSAGRCWSALAT